MRFLCFYRPNEKTRATPPTKEHMERMMKFMEESTKSGVLVATGAVLEGAPTVRASLSGGRFTVKDGEPPKGSAAFHGWAILDVKSREDLVEQIRKFLETAGDGENEAFQLMDGPPDVG